MDNHDSGKVLKEDRLSFISFPVNLVSQNFASFLQHLQKIKFVYEDL